MRIKKMLFFSKFERGNSYKNKEFRLAVQYLNTVFKIWRFSGLGY